MSRRKTKDYDLIVVGAGASGLMAAITAAGQGTRVLLLDQADRPGRKLYATGNGRCNFTNKNISPDCYYGNRELFAGIYETFDLYDTLSFFKRIGIFPKEKNGYYYPNSMQAESVVSAFVRQLELLNICLKTSAKVTGLSQKRDGILVETAGEVFLSDSVIVASGLKASPKLGSDGSMIPVLKELGHRFNPIFPALTGFHAEGMDFKKVSGVRCEAKLTLLIDGCEAKRECGELQLADYGVSGIPVFQISSLAAYALYEKRDVRLIINFLPSLSKEEVREELRRRKNLKLSLNGLINNKLIPQLIKKDKLPEALTAYEIRLTKVRDFANAQVSGGGIRSEEIDPETLESRLVSGLFFAGEILDIDGICGGYNLQWAWSSGYAAGMSAAAYIKVKSHDKN